MLGACPYGNARTGGVDNFLDWLVQFVAAVVDQLDWLS